VTAVRVHVNGDEAEWPAGTTVRDVVARVCDSDRGVAVAVGRVVVPRSRWPSTVLEDGDRVEVVTAAAGG
jgi:sulfur carrier protein